MENTDEKLIIWIELSRLYQTLQHLLKLKSHAPV